MQEPAARKPWFASRMLRLSPSAAEMISPSWSAMGRPGHSFQVGAVVVERRRVHVRDHQRLARHGQGRDMRRVCVDDALHVGAAGTPRNESARRVGRAGSVQHFHVLVDADDRGRDDLVERVGHGCRQERAVVLAHGDLAREGFRMAFAGENAAAQGHLFLRPSFRSRACSRSAQRRRRHGLVFPAWGLLGDNGSITRPPPPPRD